MKDNKGGPPHVLDDDLELVGMDVILDEEPPLNLDDDLEFMGMDEK